MIEAICMALVMCYTSADFLEQPWVEKIPGSCVASGELKLGKLLGLSPGIDTVCSKQKR